MIPGGGGGGVDPKHSLSGELDLGLDWAIEILEFSNIESLLLVLVLDHLPCPATYCRNRTNNNPGTVKKRRLRKKTQKNQ